MACRIEKFEFRTKARAGSAVSLWASLFAMTNREQTPA